MKYFLIIALSAVSCAAFAADKAAEDARFAAERETKKALAQEQRDRELKSASPQQHAKVQEVPRSIAELSREVIWTSERVQSAEEAIFDEFFGIIEKGESETLRKFLADHKDFPVKTLRVREIKPRFIKRYPGSQPPIPQSRWVEEDGIEFARSLATTMDYLGKSQKAPQYMLIVSILEGAVRQEIAKVKLGAETSKATA